MPPTPTVKTSVLASPSPAATKRASREATHAARLLLPRRYRRHPDPASSETPGEAAGAARAATLSRNLRHRRRPLLAPYRCPREENPGPDAADARSAPAATRPARAPSSGGSWSGQACRRLPHRMTTTVHRRHRRPESCDKGGGAEGSAVPIPRRPLPLPGRWAADGFPAGADACRDCCRPFVPRRSAKTTGPLAGSSGRPSQGGGFESRCGLDHLGARAVCVRSEKGVRAARGGRFGG